MKQLWRRLLAGVLTAVMAVSLLPAAALAALLDNTPDQNQEILEALAGLCGSEEEAERYYAVLQQYGLLDEDGNAVERWSVTLDGEEVSLADIRALLEDPDADRSRAVLVDGTPITLGDLETILKIEDYIAYLRETYYGDQHWTQEELDNLNGLVDQINQNGGLRLAAEAAETEGPGLPHSTQTRLVFHKIEGQTPALNSDYTFRLAVRNGSPTPTRDVTVEYRAFSSGVEAFGAGTVTIPAGERSADVTIHIGNALSEHIQGWGLFVVNFRNLRNALFSYGDRTAGYFTDQVPLTDETVYAWKQEVKIKWGTDGCATDESEWNEHYFNGDRVVGKTGTKVELFTRDLNLHPNADPTHDFEMGIEVLSMYFDRYYTVNHDVVMDKYPSPSKITQVYSNEGDHVYFCFGEDGVNDVKTPRIGPIFGTSTDNSKSVGLPFGCFYYPATVMVNGVKKLRFKFVADVSKYSVNYRTLYASEKDGPLYADWTLEYVPKVNITQNSPYGGTAYMRDATATCTVLYSTPEAVFYPGEAVPITARFSFPIKWRHPHQGSYPFLNVDGRPGGWMYVAEEGDGNAQDLYTFLYEVPQYAPVTKFGEPNHRTTLVGAGGKDIKLTGTEAGSNLQNPTIIPVERSRAVYSLTGVIEDQLTAHPVMKVTVNIDRDPSRSEWVPGDLEPLQGGGYQSKSMTVSVDGEHFYPLTTMNDNVIGDTLTAEVPVPVNGEGKDILCRVGLFLDGVAVMDRYADAPQAAPKFLESYNVGAGLKLILPGTSKKVEFSADKYNPVYVQDLVWMGTDYGFSRLDGHSFTEPDQFRWSSSDESVATIRPDGTVVPTGKPGEVYFTLHVLNGGVEAKQFTMRLPRSGEVVFAVGLNPFLSIPNNALEATEGQDVTVYWSSNLSDKNGETPTEFTVTLKRDGEVVQTYTVSGTASAPAAKCVIPAEDLEFDYDGGVNSYTVTVSCTYGGKDYTAEASIGLNSRPAQVSLGKPRPEGQEETYFLLDTAGSVTIPWSVTNLDRATNVPQNEVFQFRITQEGTEIDTSEVKLNLSGGADSGTFVLDIPAFDADPDNPASYRQVYTVTLQAKNGTDSTWSYDSFLLYVYDEGALKIWVDGQAPGEDPIRISNVKRISEMSPEEIVALRRDIPLKRVIAANYGQYAWGEIADQIRWASDNSSVASVTYKQGMYYENIENFTYVSYRPTTDFGLSGQEEGTATITATHARTGMSDSVDVEVERLDNQLYLFQCYPQAETTLTYTTGKGETRTVTSDSTGAAAVYLDKSEGGITGNVYCVSTCDGNGYRGTIYPEALKSGEGDWTRLELYPCNTLHLRRTAYAYLYLKNPDGTPYTGAVSFRGGIYVNGQYQPETRNGLFFLNGNNQTPQRGDEGIPVELGTDGRLEVAMDQTLWDSGTVKAGDQVAYIFELTALEGGGEKLDYFPLFINVNASANQNTYVSSGEAIVNFRTNSTGAKRPFLAMQAATLGGSLSSVMDYTGHVGVSDNAPNATLTTAVMWWGEEGTEAVHSLQLETAAGQKIAAGEGQYSLETTAYPFTTYPVTNYTVRLNSETVDSVLSRGRDTGVTLKYYTDGLLTRSEQMPYRLSNLLGRGAVENSGSVRSEVQSMGGAFGTSAKSGNTGELSGGDGFVGTALEIIGELGYTKGEGKLFSIRVAPTGDPTKFLGFITANIGNLDFPDEDQVTGLSGPEEGELEATPGFDELMVLAGGKSPMEYGQDVMDEYRDAAAGKGIRSVDWAIGGYMESLIFYDFDRGEWMVQILDGGFNAGAGMSVSWHVNAWAGIIPFTATLTVGGNAQVSMDALSVAYYDTVQKQYGTGNDFLTELRLYLYLRFFAGVGFDYSVVAFKLGVFGQIDLDMRFQWLNRPYMSGGTVRNVADGRSDGNLNGQHFAITGQVGLELLIKLLFIEYEKVLCSASFNLLDKSTGQWNTIQTSWNKNSAALDDTIAGLMNDGSVSVYTLEGQQLVALNLAPTLEDNRYLEEGSYWDDSGFSLFALDDPNGLAGLAPLNYNTYAYANPVVTDDGEIVALLQVPSAYGDNYQSGDPVEAMFARQNDAAYERPQAIGGEAGYGDSQLSLAGSKDFAVAAWTRQMVDVNKDSGTVLTGEDQMMMLNGSEVFASVYSNGSWTTTRFTNNSGADMAPVAAANGGRALVAWRSVAASGKAVGESGSETAGLATFDQKDCILYKVYEGGQWSDERTLYNGTSGAVKGIVADMTADGTAAVAYTLDMDGDDNTTTDREIVYAVIGTDGTDGETVRTVQATNDSYLDENPQLTAVKFGDEERFVLGWYTEQSAASDGAAALDGGAASGETVSDIRLLEFGADGDTRQLLPDSMNAIASRQDVSVTANFRFTKNSETINDLSILWVERAKEVTANEESQTLKMVEKDVLKGVKLYTYGQNGELIGFTAAVDVAEMEDGTLIDHFDAYVSDAGTNEIKAVLLGTTYDATNPETKEAQTAGGEIVSYQVPARRSDLYTATESYTDKIQVPSFLPDYNAIRLGADTQIQFTVENRGIHTIPEITIQVGGETTVYPDLNLLPGSGVRLLADYQVPSDRVVDPNYTVTAVFDQNSGAAGRAGGRSGAGANVASGTIYLDLPDLEITRAEVVCEELGQRTIQIGLNNHAEAALAGFGRAVRLSFFSDAARTVKIDGLEDIVIDSDADLRAVDEGGYSRQVTFDVGEYVKGTDGADREIPAGGVTVYLKAEVLDRADSAGQRAVQGEPTVSDNRESFRCDNLRERTGQAVTATYDLCSDASGSQVTVTLQNTRLTETTSGNVIVTLLDESGAVLAEQQSYAAGSANDGFVTLAGEEKKTFTFLFDQAGSNVLVSYTDALLESGTNTSIADLTLSGIPLTYDESRRTWLIPGAYAGSGSGLLTIVPEDPRVSITVDGQPYTVTRTQALPRGSEGIPITVTAQDGTATETYYLALEDDVPPVNPPSGGGSGGGGSSRYEVTVTKPAHGEVSVSPSGAGRGSTVTLTVMPEEGYGLEALSVTDSRGNEVKLTAQGGGRYTFSMPAGPVTVKVLFKPLTGEAPCDGGPDCLSHGFTDLGDVEAWYHEAVDFALRNGLMSGYGDGLFGPDRHLTRAQLAQILYNREGRPAVTDGGAFTDVAGGTWYADGIAWAAAEGIVSGYGGGKFGPNDNITREQLATILWRCSGNPAATGEELRFSDAEEISGYALDAIRWAVEAGILNGYGDGRLNPKGLATRAQAAQMLKNFIEGQGNTP